MVLFLRSDVFCYQNSGNAFFNSDFVDFLRKFIYFWTFIVVDFGVTFFSPGLFCFFGRRFVFLAKFGEILLFNRDFVDFR